MAADEDAGTYCLLFMVLIALSHADTTMIRVGGA